LRQFPAPTVTDARTWAAGPLADIVQDYSLVAVARKLDPVPGVSNTYVALNTPGDFSSGAMEGWILPQLVPRPNGLPSSGYAVRLYDGDPDAGGVEVFTTDGTTGTGINKTVAWFFDYAGGLLLLSDTSSLFTGAPYVNGFVYIGETVGDLAPTIINVGGDWIGDVGGDVTLVIGDQIGNVNEIGTVGGDVNVSGDNNDVNIGDTFRSYNQSLVGTIDGVNLVYTTTSKFVRTATDTETLYINGFRLNQGISNDYLVTESVLGLGYDTITFDEAPLPADVLRIDFTPT